MTTTSARDRLRRLVRSAPTHLVVAGAALLLLSYALTQFAISKIVEASVDDRIERELREEVAGLRASTDSVDPATGKPYGADVTRLLDAYLSRPRTAGSPSVVTFVDGEPFERTAFRAPYWISIDEQLTELWSGVSTPDRGTVDLTGGSLEYLAVPLVEQERTRAVAVVAMFREQVAQEVIDGWPLAPPIATALVMLAVMAAAGAAYVLSLALRRRRRGVVTSTGLEPQRRAVESPR